MNISTRKPIRFPFRVLNIWRACNFTIRFHFAITAERKNSQSDSVERHDVIKMQCKRIGIIKANERLHFQSYFCSIVTSIRGKNQRIFVLHAWLQWQRWQCRTERTKFRSHFQYQSTSEQQRRQNNFIFASEKNCFASNICVYVWWMFEHKCVNANVASREFFTLIEWRQCLSRRCSSVT